MTGIFDDGSWQDRVAAAKREIDELLPAGKDRLEFELVFCDQCGEETVVCPDPTSRDGTVHCFACDARFFTHPCDGCGAPILFSKPLSLVDGPYLHEECQARILSRF